MRKLKIKPCRRRLLLILTGLLIVFSGERTVSAGEVDYSPVARPYSVEDIFKVEDKETSFRFWRGNIHKKARPLLVGL